MLVTSAAGPESDRWSDSLGPSDQATGPKRTDINVLVLEDDSIFGEMLSELLCQEGTVPCLCSTVTEAKKAVSQRNFDFYILDQHLPDGTGTTFYYTLLDLLGAVPAIMLTGSPDISKAVALTKTGLLNYLTKPFTIEQLRSSLAQGLALRGEANPRETETLRSASPSMRQVISQVRLAASNNSSTVLLTGETGVGKDVVARTIHRLSQTQPGSSLPFVSLNCATLPADMFESELFGAERGAYTGAHQQRPGLVDAAEGGTLFLDELGEIPLHLQAKLLHLLENREYRRLGAATPRKFSGRIIAATNKSLHEAVEAGTFRADLLYRLDVFSIHLPPLRERKEDLPALSRAILSELSERYGRKAPHVITEDLEVLASYSFPGNIRELRNLLERSLLATADDCAWLQLSPEAKKKISENRNITSPRNSVPSTSDARFSVVEAQEFNLVRDALIREKGKIRRAAARLAMSHQAVLRRLEKWPDLREYVQESRQRLKNDPHQVFQPSPSER